MKASRLLLVVLVVILALGPLSASAASGQINFTGSVVYPSPFTDGVIISGSTSWNADYLQLNSTGLVTVRGTWDQNGSPGSLSLAVDGWFSDRFNVAILTGCNGWDSLSSVYTGQLNDNQLYAVSGWSVCTDRVGYWEMRISHWASSPGNRVRSVTVSGFPYGLGSSIVPSTYSGDPTPTSTSTNTPVPPTNTPIPTETFTPTPTETFTPVPTNTGVPTNTPIPATETPTNTAVPPTNTPTNTPEPTETFTPVPTNTSVPTNTPYPTAVYSGTSTPPPVVPTVVYSGTSTPAPVLPTATLGPTSTPYVGSGAAYTQTLPTPDWNTYAISPTLSMGMSGSNIIANMNAFAGMLGGLLALILGILLGSRVLRWIRSNVR